jgi:hypothetical protein
VSESGGVNGGVSGVSVFIVSSFSMNMGNNKISELRTIFQRESQNSLKSLKLDTIKTLTPLTPPFKISLHLVEAFQRRRLKCE